MAQLPNPPQFDMNESEEARSYKLKQFVDEMVRSFRELNDEVGSGGGGSANSSAHGYPQQLGHARI